MTKQLAQTRTHSNHNTPLKLNLLSTIWLLEHITRDDAEHAKFILKRNSGAVRLPQQK